MTAEFIFFGIIVFLIWYYFFYEKPTEIDNIVSSLKTDLSKLRIELSQLGENNQTFVSRNIEGFINSASMPDTDDIKQFYKRATDFSNNIAIAENKINDMTEQFNKKNFDIAASDANKILEANKKRVDIANLTQTIQQSYIENTTALNKLMTDYKAFVNTNTIKLKEMASISIPNYLLRNLYVKNFQPVRDGLYEIHYKIREFLKKNGIDIDPIPADLLQMKTI
jgi:hypothetical protein